MANRLNRFGGIMVVIGIGMMWSVTVMIFGFDIDKTDLWKFPIVALVLMIIGWYTIERTKINKLLFTRKLE